MEGGGGRESANCAEACHFWEKARRRRGEKIYLANYALLLSSRRHGEGYAKEVFVPLREKWHEMKNYVFLS